MERNILNQKTLKMDANATAEFTSVISNFNFYWDFKNHVYKIPTLNIASTSANICKCDEQNYTIQQYTLNIN